MRVSCKYHFFKHGAPYGGVIESMNFFSGGMQSCVDYLKCVNDVTLFFLLVRTDVVPASIITCCSYGLKYILPSGKVRHKYRRTDRCR